MEGGTNFWDALGVIGRAMVWGVVAILGGFAGLRWLWPDVRRWIAKRRLVQRDNAYWDKESNAGPYCPKCIHTDGQRVLASSTGSEGLFLCPVCNSHIRLPSQPEPSPTHVPLSEMMDAIVRYIAQSDHAVAEVADLRHIFSVPLGTLQHEIHTLRARELIQETSYSMESMEYYELTPSGRTYARSRGWL